MNVDVHILLLPETDQNLWQQCQQTLEAEPINLLTAEGIHGHIGRARARAFELGDSPYVSFVDPDDLVIPGAFAACIKTLNAHPEACGTFTDEILIASDGKPIRPGFFSDRPWNPLQMLEPQYMHHLLVMRRSALQPYLKELDKWPNLAEFVLKGLMVQQGPWVRTNMVGYKWRINNQQTTAHKQFHVAGVNAARWRIIPLLYQAARKYQSSEV